MAPTWLRISCTAVAAWDGVEFDPAWAVPCSRIRRIVLFTRLLTGLPGREDLNSLTMRRTIPPFTALAMAFFCATPLSVACLACLAFAFAPDCLPWSPLAPPALGKADGLAEACGAGCFAAVLAGGSDEPLPQPAMRTAAATAAAPPLMRAFRVN